MPKGKHHRPEYVAPGRDTLFPRHSAEERSAETSSITSVDIQRQAGILPRDTPAQGYSRVVYRPAPGPEEDGEPGRSLNPSIASRVAVVAVLALILLIVVMALQGG